MIQWFWYLLTIACIVWYSTITIYVAFRGSFDIKNMLARLAKDLPEPPEKAQEKE
jgi:hypothetical protein